MWTPTPTTQETGPAGLPLHKSAFPPFFFFFHPALIIYCLSVLLEACVTEEVVALVEQSW